MSTSPNVERFSGYANLYDRYRPTPPDILAQILTQLIKIRYPHLVVDLGSGTGLSTHYWAEKAEQVIGIEPNEEMRCQAEAQHSARNISYRHGFSHETGLADACAQIVVCSQALHWMRPQPTFEEVRRILQHGGVFAAFDYDWPPTTQCWEADAAYVECSQRVRELGKKLPDSGVIHFDKDQHLARMQTSQCFRYTKEILTHHTDLGNAERFVGIALSQGSVQTLLKSGYSEADIGIDQLRQIADTVLGSQPNPWYWSSRVRIGIK